ncbi:MAG: pyridoxamine 5'-phosphate oxidase family protein [Candidatus Diapherotrites archaeon]|nr:pyridoxamine 5'-phosphate oxidase family protein [Candidatus Diapherotrites archaeon]
MKFSPKLKKAIEKGILSFSTVGRKASPHTIYVACVKVTGGSKFLITDNYMRETVKNIKTRKKVSLAILFKGAGFEFSGTAKYFLKGKYYALAKMLPANKGLPCKGAVLVTVSKMKRMK